VANLYTNFYDDGALSSSISTSLGITSDGPIPSTCASGNEVIAGGLADEGMWSSSEMEPVSSSLSLAALDFLCLQMEIEDLCPCPAIHGLVLCNAHSLHRLLHQPTGQ
jgi:hypothetical protein